MQYRKHVIKALLDLSSWGYEHRIADDLSGARYRAFIEKLDNYFDHLCHILFELAEAIVGHRQLIMDADWGMAYLTAYVKAQDERPLFAELNQPERFNHGMADAKLPKLECLQESIEELIGWADDRLDTINKVKNTNDYNRFMTDLDIGFEAFLKWHEIYDLDAMVPLLNKPAEKWRPFLENVDDMININGPETWPWTLVTHAPIMHAAPARLQ